MKHLIWLLAAPTALQASPVQRELERMLDDAPGIQYAFASANDILYSYEGGKSDIFSGAIVERETAFAGFSVTKTFTALAVLQLADQKKIDLDAPLSLYLPGQAVRYDSGNETSQPTVRQTLNHTAGFANPMPLRWIHRLDRPFHRQTWEDSLLKEHAILKGRPGAKFAYSNIGYVALGRLIENQSGLAYDEYINRHVLAPLQLRSDERLFFRTSSTPHGTGHAARWSPATLLMSFLLSDNKILSSESKGGWRTLQPVQMNGLAYGGLSGNHRGFIRYLQAMLKGSAPFTPQIRDSLLAGDRLPVTLAWWRGDLNGEPYFSHAGGGGGFYAEIRLYPRLGRASVLLLNRTGLTDARMLDRLDRFFIDSNAP